MLSTGRFWLRGINALFGMETFFPVVYYSLNLQWSTEQLSAMRSMNTKISWINSITRFCLSNIFHFSDRCLPRSERYKEFLPGSVVDLEQLFSGYRKSLSLLTVCLKQNSFLPRDFMRSTGCAIKSCCILHLITGSWYKMQTLKARDEISRLFVNPLLRWRTTPEFAFHCSNV